MDTTCNLSSWNREIEQEVMAALEAVIEKYGEQSFVDYAHCPLDERDGHIFESLSRLGGWLAIRGRLRTTALSYSVLIKGKWY